MPTLIEWIKYWSDGEDIEAVIIGEMGWTDYNEISADYKSVIGKVMSLDEAMPYLTYEFSSGYGSPGCTAIAVYTKTWIISVGQYDGATFPFRIARNPFEGFIPDMPGG